MSDTHQGGDLRGHGHVHLDLSTCVNPYGPPDAVLAALRTMPAAAVRAHPYGAAGEVESAYAGYLGLPAGEFTAGRGTSDLIWALAQHLAGQTVGLPLPAYTEFWQAFPHARTFGGGPSTHSLDVLDEAMRACGAVIISNPHNPTGQVIPRHELADLAGRHPSRVLVVDESYMDFLADHAAMTLAGCDADNVIVLRSPSKFFGLAGMRSGVAWSRHPLRAQLADRRTNWPVSAFAATALKAALAEHDWAARARQDLAADVRWLDGCLTRPGLHAAAGRLHFRLLTGTGEAIRKFADALGAHGIAVRVLEQSHGAGSPAARVSAPRQQDRWLVAAALGDMTTTG